MPPPPPSAASMAFWMASVQSTAPSPTAPKSSTLYTVRFMLVNLRSATTRSPAITLPRVLTSPASAATAVSSSLGTLASSSTVLAAPGPYVRAAGGAKLAV